MNNYEIMDDGNREGNRIGFLYEFSIPLRYGFMTLRMITILITVFLLVQINAFSQVQTWRGVDEFGLEENTLLLHPDGFYKFYEESVVLLEDSLEVTAELGKYRKHANKLTFLPLTGKTAYRPFSYTLETQRDSMWQLFTCALWIKNQ
ncbi:MAG: hypothetical protein AB8G22_18630 [Saprospiraceae bacterium]